jgi:hypothetical protein
MTTITLETGKVNNAQERAIPCFRSLRIVTVLALALWAIATPELVEAGSKPDFSGTWRLNLFESDLGGLPVPVNRTDVIEQHEPNLKVTTTFGDADKPSTQIAYYSTDGQYSTNQIGEREVTSKLHWENDSLVIVSIVSLDNGDATTNSVWTLSDSGATLTEKTHLAMGGREIDQKFVFERSDPRVGVPANTTNSIESHPAGVNLTGTWNLNIAKSNFGSLTTPVMQIDVIEQHGDMIRINTSEDNGPDGKREYTRSLMANGKPGPDQFAGKDATSVAYFADNQLLVKTSLVFQGSEVNVETLYELAGDRNTLVQSRHIKSAPLTTDQRLVFDRQ